MHKRPKPGETEDDLLEFQKQFMAQKCAPSASVSKKAGSKRLAKEQDISTEHRDVVKIEDLQKTLPATEQVPPIKKSRFKAAQEHRDTKQSQRARSQLQADDAIDDHDKTTGTVLAKIIERDTHNAPCNMPTRVMLPFPSISQIATTPAQCNVSVKKKKSLFAQQFAASPELFGITQREPQAPGQMTMVTDDCKPHTADHISSVIDGTGLSATFSKREANEIHAENMERLSGMSEQEVMQEQRKLIQTLDPKLVAFLKVKQSKGDEKPISKHDRLQEEKQKSDVLRQTNKKRSEPEAVRPVEVDKDCIHMDKVEHDKLEWMKDLPPPSADSSKTGQQARFDFQGNLIHADADIPVNMGLHHHGDEPERAGYALEELFTLARSTNNQQKFLALTTLSRIITQAREGNLAAIVQTPILPSIIDAGVVFLLRWSLDDGVESVMGAAVAALNALLVNHADQHALERVHNWHQGHRIACQAPAKPDEVGIKLPGYAEEKAQQTDAELAKEDVILALGSRMNLIQRLSYILTTVRPQAPVVVAILQILTKLCRHSTQLAYQVFNYKGLLELVIREFLPLSWNLKGMHEPVSSVYGVPLKEAMTLICTLCQAGKNMAAILLSRLQIEDILLRFLLTDTKSMQLPDLVAHGLHMESLGTWKVCLTYGLADNIYIELYPVIVERLRCCDGALDRPSNDQDRIAALVSCLEMAVCVATTQHKSHSFKHSQDGSSMEVDRSEDVVVATINWAHVADLIQPIRALLTSTLCDLASSYQIKKQNLQLPTACLNFITTYYVHSQSQLHGVDVVTCLQDMETVYAGCIQHWTSIGFTSICSKLSKHSNLLQPVELKTHEQCNCLPEYGNSSVQEDRFVPTVGSQSPYGFLVAWYRMVYNFTKVHRGLQTTKGQMSSSESVASPMVVLQSQDLRTYVRKIAAGKLSHLVHNFFTKFETHLLYYVLKLAAVMPASDSGIDMTVIHHVSLKLLTCLQYGDGYMVHDLLSTVVFNPVFIKLETEPVTAHLQDLSLSAPIHLHTATEEEVEVVSEQLIADAQQNLTGIRASYLAALSHSEQLVVTSRNHYVGDTMATESCFTANIGESLMPNDWMFMPMIELYNTYSCVGSEVQNILSSHQLDTVRNVLRWIYLTESCRAFVLEGVSVTLKLSRIMCVFLTGNDMFLDRAVHCFLAGILRYYTKPSILSKLDFSEHIPGLPSFYDMYVSLLQQYEAVSFGDSLFGCYILIALQQRHSVQYRKAVWTEYTGIQRTLTLPLNQLLLPIQLYLEPEETNVELIRRYYQSLYSGSLRPCWCPVLYLVAVHHVNRFMYTQDKAHRKLKSSMLTQILNSKNEELKKHLVSYKQTDMSHDFGMDLYSTLPAIRQNYIDSLKQ